MLNFYDDHGVSFRYPESWELESSVDADGIVTLAIGSPDGGTAFVLIRLDADGPDPEDLVAEAFAAMRGEYPGLEAEAASEQIDGHETRGLDFAFLSLDVANSAEVRAFRTPRRTVFLLAQWSDIDGERPEGLVHDLRESFQETDSEID